VQGDDGADQDGCVPGSGRVDLRPRAGPPSGDSRRCRGACQYAKSSLNWA